MTTMTLPSEVPSLPTFRARASLSAAPSQSRRRVHALPEDVPDVVLQLVRAIVECLAGHRPVHQVVRFVSSAAAARLAQTAAAGTLRRARLGSVRAQIPRPGAVEVSIRLVTDVRSLACAARIERKATKWVCTDLQL